MPDSRQLVWRLPGRRCAGLSWNRSPKECRPCGRRASPAACGGSRRGRRRTQWPSTSLHAAAAVLVAALAACADGSAGRYATTAGGTDMGSDLSFEPGPAPVEPPRYGGELNVGTVYVTLSALSWDTTDWNWKQNHDTGMLYEQLFVADLDQAAVRGGDQRFVSEAYLSAETIRGEVAASWEWEDPLTLVIEVRRGMTFPDKPGVMEARELDAHDVVFSFERQRDSPKAIPTYFDHIDRVVGQGRPHGRLRVRGVQRRVGLSLRLRLLLGHRAAGTGRRRCQGLAERHRHGTLLAGAVHSRQLADLRPPPGLLGPDRDRRREVRDSRSSTSSTYRTIKDEATRLTALRTGKLDILENIRWLAVDHLKKTTPELRWSRWLSTGGTFMVMRVDQEPFGDRRVRRAMNLAVDQREIVDLFFGGNAELFAYPQHPTFEGYYEPLEAMPPSVQELFEYKPDKARRLIAEAGYPDGFTFRMQVSVSDPMRLELAPLLASYFERVGVTMEIEVVEYAAYLSMMTTRTHGPGYLMGSGHVNPTTTLRKNFVTGQTWNPSMWSDPELDRRVHEMFLTRDEADRQEIVKRITKEMLDEAPYLWLPVPYVYTAWWPWVKNYGGELRAGAVRPGPIYARLWIDREMKREMGFLK